jgi:hypothetical protein
MDAIRKPQVAKGPVNPILCLPQTRSVLAAARKHRVVARTNPNNTTRKSVVKGNLEKILLRLDEILIHCAH